MSACAFEGCAKPRRSSGQPLCEGHYAQRYRGRELTPLKEFLPPITQTTCGIEGCEKPRRRRYCPMHEARIKRHGNPDTVIAPSERKVKRGPANYNWTEEPSYTAVHQRCRKWFGRPREFTCECGEVAAQWAYIGPREADQRRPWSSDVTLYKPMCVRCHKNMDMARIMGKTA